MKQIAKQFLDERNTLATQLMERYTDLEGAVEAFNDALERQWAHVEAAMNAYNESVEEANAWLADIASEIETYISERSEKWQKSPRGCAYAAWQDEYASEELELIEMEMPDILTLEWGDQVDVLESCAEEVPTE